MDKNINDPAHDGAPRPSITEEPVSRHHQLAGAAIDAMHADASWREDDTCIVLVNSSDGQGGMGVWGYGNGEGASKLAVLREVMAHIAVFFAAAGINLTFRTAGDEHVPEEEITEAEALLGSMGSSPGMQQVLDILKYMLGKRKDTFGETRVIVIMSHAPAEGEEPDEDGELWGMGEVMHHGFRNEHDVIQTFMRALMGFTAGSQEHRVMIVPIVPPPPSHTMS